MVTSLLRVVEKSRQAVSKLLEGAQPGVENRATLVREGVRPLRRAGQIAAPLGRNEPLVLERPQRAVDVADVDALVADELGQALEELVPVRRPVREESEECGLAEALDPRADFPAPVRKPSATARS